MLTQFSRTELLLGKEAMDRLKNVRVAVFGIGGVGIIEEWFIIIFISQLLSV